MKTRLLIIIGILAILVVLPIENTFAEEQMLILVDDNIRKLYYTGENIISSFFDSDASSVIFETGNNATLDVKIPKLHKFGEDLFVLRNGKESIVDKQSDDCFYHVTLQTQFPEKIKFIITYWPEQYTKLSNNCEKISTAPLKQIKSGITIKNIQCKESLTLVVRYNGSPACVKLEIKTKLFERGWIHHDESLSIKFVPLILGHPKYTFDWCTTNNGIWDDARDTCYLQSQKDLEQSLIDLQAYIKSTVEPKENEN